MHDNISSERQRPLKGNLNTVNKKGKGNTWRLKYSVSDYKVTQQEHFVAPLFVSL